MASREIVQTDTVYVTTKKRTMQKANEIGNAETEDRDMKEIVAKCRKAKRIPDLQLYPRTNLLSPFS